MAASMALDSRGGFGAAFLILLSMKGSSSGMVMIFRRLAGVSISSTEDRSLTDGVDGCVSDIEGV